MNQFFLKSIGAGLAGFVTVVVLSIGTDFALVKLGIFPSSMGLGYVAPW